MIDDSIIVILKTLVIHCNHDLMLQRINIWGDASCSCLWSWCEFGFLTLNMGLKFSCALRRRKWAVESFGECKRGRVSFYLCPYMFMYLYVYIHVVSFYSSVHFCFVSAYSSGDGCFSPYYDLFFRWFCEIKSDPRHGAWIWFILLTHNGLTSHQYFSLTDTVCHQEFVCFFFKLWRQLRM